MVEKGALLVPDVGTHLIYHSTYEWIWSIANEPDATVFGPSIL